MTKKGQTTNSSFEHFTASTLDLFTPALQDFDRGPIGHLQNNQDSPLEIQQYPVIAFFRQDTTPNIKFGELLEVIATKT